MANEFKHDVEHFINSLNENSLEIYYQAFDFSNVNDSRTRLTKLNYDKNKVSVLNLEMVRMDIQLQIYYCILLDCRHVSSICCYS